LSNRVADMLYCMIHFVHPTHQHNSIIFYINFDSYLWVGEYTYHPEICHT